MFGFGTKKKSSGVNEFNQSMKSVSLWDDAWKRLRKNKMDLISLWVVLGYIVVALAAPILPIYPYEEQVVAHINLPPSLKPAGEVMLARRIAYLNKVMKAEKRTELTTAEKQELEDMKKDIEVKN